jgi:hypothetical protein
MFPIGHIIHSYTCNTEAKVKASYRGNSWSQISGRFLYGSTSAGTTGGSNDAIIPYHTHTWTQASCTNPGNYQHSGVPQIWVGGYGGGNWKAAGTNDPMTYGNTGAAGGHTHTVTGTNSYAGTSGNTTNANMPAYYTCYIWRRVS